MKNTPPHFISISAAARRLGVPARWLKEQAKADKIPSLKAGRSTLIHLPTVVEVLSHRMQAAKEDSNES